MAERGPLVPWPEPPPQSKPPLATRVWTVLRRLQRAGWLRPRRVGCLLVVLLLVVLAVFWALSAAVNGTLAMFRNDPPVVTGNPLQPVAPPPPATSGSPTLDRIERHHKLIVAAQHTPGFAEETAPNNWSGFDIALVDLLVDNLGLRRGSSDFAPGGDIEATDALARGEYDILVGGYQIGAQPGSQVAVAGPYLVSPIRLATPTNGGVSGVDSLGNGKVCAVQGSAVAEQMQDRLGDRLITAGSVAACGEQVGSQIRALAGQPVKAVAGDELTLRALPGMADGRFREVGATLGTVEYGIAVPPGDEVFRRRVNAVLRRAIEDGTWARLYTQYFGTPAPAPPAPR